MIVLKETDLNLNSKHHQPIRNRRLILVFHETHDLSKLELDSPLLHRNVTPNLIRSRLLKTYIVFD